MLYKNDQWSRYEEYYSSGQLYMSIDFGPSSIKKYYDKDGKLTKTEEPVESSYCSGEQTGPNCIKVQEYNYWGRVSKTYYEWSFYA